VKAGEPLEAAAARSGEVGALRDHECLRAPPRRGEPVGIEGRAFCLRALFSISTGEWPAGHAERERSALAKVLHNCLITQRINRPWGSARASGTRRAGGGGLVYL
jgi:hypothetical protein